MIRLSQLTALHISDQDIARDLDVSPKLYLYESNQAVRKDKLLVQEDTSPLQQMTRGGALATMFSNVLLGTANFYPEQGLSIDDYHTDSLLQTKLNDSTLPVIEYKQATLYFSQGSLADQTVLGHYVRIFCKLSNGSEVTLASVVDFLNDSAVTAQTPKLFESQVWNEGIKIEFIDVEYLLNSGVTEIDAVKTAIFGNSRPTEVMIEYSAFGADAVDQFTQNGFQFTRLNFQVVNQQSFPVTFETQALVAQLSLDQDGFVITSRLIHQRFDVTAYLNTLKAEEETYRVEHQVLVTSYDSSDVLLTTTKLAMRAFDDQPFDGQLLRPLCDLQADHFKLDVTIVVQNRQTGLTHKSSNSIVVTANEVGKFKAAATIELTGMTSDILQTVVNRQVNQIVTSPEVPRIIQLERKVYVIAQPLKELQLIDADFTARITVAQDVAGNSKLFLQIDQLVIESEQSELLTFMIPKFAYSTNSASYTLLDQNSRAISTGKITKQ